MTSQIRKRITVSPFTIKDHMTAPCCFTYMFKIILTGYERTLTQTYSYSSPSMKFIDGYSYFEMTSLIARYRFHDSISIFKDSISFKRQLKMSAARNSFSTLFFCFSVMSVYQSIMKDFI